MGYKRNVQREAVIYTYKYTTCVRMFMTILFLHSDYYYIIKRYIWRNFKCVYSV
jgi:hypothetical protein